MANISEEKWIEILEKKSDGSFVAKYPKVKSKSGVTFDEHLVEKATQNEYGHIRLQDIPNPTVATKTEAEVGTNNTKMMTPLTTKQAIDVSRISIKSGKVSGGGIIPQSSGYTNYHYFVSIANVEATDFDHLLFRVTASVNQTTRVVTISVGTGNRETGASGIGERSQQRCNYIEFAWN